MFIIERMVLWSGGQDPEASVSPAGRCGHLHSAGPLCLFASARRCLDQITVKVLTGQKIFRF